MKFISIGAVAGSALGSLEAIAGPFDAETLPDHFVPADKKLKPEWVKSLFARGKSTWYSGCDLKTIGMPIGGIGAGQVYLTGDGQLVHWGIFNRDLNSGGGTPAYKEGRGPTEMFSPQHQDFIPAPEVDQGVAIRVKSGGESWTRSLDVKGFPNTRFLGEYPIARVDYVDQDFPVHVNLEAFSPFTPLNATDSTLPATLLNYTVKNRGTEKVEVTLAGWLQNAVCLFSGPSSGDTVQRVNRVVRGDGITAVQGAVRQKKMKPKDQEDRPPIVFADFDGDDYGKWKVAGEAFGKGPAKGTLQNQQPVTGFQGQGLVNSYRGGNDEQKGRLTSPVFTIERKWISFLVGGGDIENRTCMNLIVDGKVVRTAMGHKQEQLKRINWDVEKFAGKRAHLEIVDDTSEWWGHINVDQIEFRDSPAPDGPAIDRRRDYGTMSVAILDGDALASASFPEGAADVVFAEKGLASTPEEAKPLDQSLRGAVGKTLSLEPGEGATVSFVVSWHMPNRYSDSQVWVGNHYNARFSDAAAVARYIAAQLDRLTNQTRLWHATYYDSTLPHWLLDRVAATLGNLATNLCQWRANGRFWAWEGTGCCGGTCGHVWNYAHALARLFPSLERSVREMQDFTPGIGFVEESGEIYFRSDTLFQVHWAGDSQGGYILKALREHQCSQDDEFLRRNWKHIKKATEFLIEKDGNADGMLEVEHFQTYDGHYYGANTFSGALYLGALRAAEVMSREMGDDAFADRCRKIFEAGRDNSVKRLFNEEYYIQDVDLAKHPKGQYAEGCLADQMFGQNWAHQVGLGYLYPQESVGKSLESVWKYCWAPDVGVQNRIHKPGRMYARPGEAGLFTCTWPKSKHLEENAMLYKNEVWTGIEYQAASHMAWEGMLTESLAICRGVHERYHPSKYNPFNEIECGDHYARSLASWGMITNLAGFEFHGPHAHFGFSPRITPDNFRGVFTAAAGWGTITQKREVKRQTNAVAVKYGELRIRSLAFDVPEEAKVTKVAVSVDGEQLACEFDQHGQRISIRLKSPATVVAPSRIQIELEHGAN